MLSCSKELGGFDSLSPFHMTKAEAELGQYKIWASKMEAQRRIAYWLTGQTPVMDNELLARQVLGKTELSVKEKRLGVLASILLWYGMGAKRFEEFSGDRGNLKFKAGLAERTVGCYRMTHQKIVKSWTDLDLSMRRVVTSAGSVVQVFNERVTMRTVQEGPYWTLYIKMPGENTLRFQHSRMADKGVVVLSDQWGKTILWGGLVLEMIVDSIYTELCLNDVIDPNAAAKLTTEEPQVCKGKAVLPFWAGGLYL